MLDYQKELAEIGFVDLGVVREKWPTNRWPRDKKYKQVGKYHPPCVDEPAFPSSLHATVF
ncbi:hypothetical protein IMZ48_37165 [Candidatus Bathyarchaeota archaeon]|nr:hypothetical protein [Candidatus Bathyarchaeota archaeon]